MPRKLLRVALVAAVLPALTPEISMAQTAKVGSSVRDAAPAPVQKKGISGWWQRVRGQKPETTPAITPVASSRVVRVAPDASKGGSAKPSFRLENSDTQMMRRETASRRPAVAEAVATPVAPATPAVTQEDRAAFENTFPDDTPTSRRTRPVSNDVATAVEPEVATAVEPEVATVVESEIVTEPAIETVSAPVAETNDFATPASSELDAYPIEAAAPPEDVTAAYNAPQGTVPQYSPTAMMTPETPADDVNFATPVPARPAGQIMNGMNGATPVYQTPPVAVYGGVPGYSRVDGAMYPSPQPGIPFHVGSTVITNPALDPHEMLYAHRYRGLYGPFYHKTTRHWVLTPFGICKNEKRVLMGTEVRVNYKSYISPCALFFPPLSY